MLNVTLFDTDILIDVGHGVENAINRLNEIAQRTSLGISVITKMELLVGCRNKREVIDLEKFLEKFHVVNLNELISEKAIHLLKQYRLSHGLLLADSLIAATAIVKATPFITKNQKDYRFLKELNLLPYS
jgi:hypothetical protein